MEPQVFDVLAYLLRHRERVVPKTELLDQIWGNRFVSESALSSRIKSARRAVGDTGRDQRIIKTIYGRGYRFVADVAEKTQSAGPPGAAPTDGTGRPGDQERHQVLRAVSDIGAGIGAAIQVSGGPGSGKTELLHQAAETARRQALAVGLSAPGSPARSPYLCVAEALDEMAQTHPGLLDASRPDAGPSSSEPSTGASHDAPALVRGGARVPRRRGGAVGCGAAARRSPSRSSRSRAPRRGRGPADPRHRLAVIIAQRSDARTRPGFEVVELAERHRPSDQHAIVDLPPR